MAESYRGLTIRIGGDTTKLTDALKAADKAVSGTQNTLKKLDQALKLDPSSLEAARLQVGALAENAASTATRLAGLRNAMQQIGQLKFGESSVEQLAESTKYAFTQAEVARVKYAAVCEEIAKIDHQVSKLTQAEADAASGGFGDKLMMAFAGAKTSVDALIAEANKLPQNIRPSTEETEEFEKSIADVVKQYGEAEKALAKFNEKRANAGNNKRDITSSENGIDRTIKKMVELEEKYQSIVEGFSTLSGTVFNFENANNSIEELTAALDALPEGIKPTDEEMEKLISHAKEFKGQFEDARDELEKFTKVAKFKDLQAEAERAAASIQKMARAIADMKTPSNALRGLYEITESTKVLDSAVSKYKSLGDTMASVAKNNTKDTAAAAAATNAYSQAIRANNERVQSLKMTLDGLKGKWEQAEAASDFGKTAEQQLLDANSAVEKSSAVIATYEGKLADAKIRMEQFGITTKEANEIIASSDWDDKTKQEAQEYLELVANAKVYASLLNLLIKEHDDLTDQQELSRLRKEWEEITMALARAEAEGVQLGDALRNVGNVNPKVDQAAFMQSIQMISNAARQMGQRIVESSNEIDEAFRDMRKTVQGTETDFNNLRDAAIEYSQTHVTSADTMLEMQALGGQLGVLVEDLQAFGTIASNLDIATNIDAEDIALQLGQISNVLGLDIEGMQGFSDALVRLGNNMPAQESAIMNVAQRFGAVATTASFSGEEILAWSAAIASTGQRSEAAATAIGNTVSGIEQALASGGNDLEQFAKIAGMSADEFKKKWESSPTQALKAFIEGLHTLTESDESAVAALENMGITGVRQQQTLLGLSQTIDKLDDALAMSTDAWNGVSDEWGQAGDAAIEAEKKSEGFSGALQILQNNAQNLGAALGDVWVEPMKVAANFLAVLTDALRAIPAPILAIVEALGAGAIAFGTIGPVVKTLTDGTNAFFQTLTKVDTISEFCASVLNIKPAMDGATAATSATATAISGPLVIGITAALAVLALIATAVKDYEEKQELARKATDGLVHATDAATTAYNDYVEGAKEATKSVQDLRDETDKLIEKQAQLADEMTDAWSEIGTSEATVDGLISKIEELTSKQSLSAQEQGELYAAVQSFNAITGQSVSVIDEQKGKLDASTDQLHKYADAWKESKESSQHLEDYMNNLKQLNENQRLLEELTERSKNSMGQMTGTMAAGTEGFRDMRNAAGGTADSYDSLSTKIKQTEANIEANKKAMEQAAANMGGMDKQVAAVEAELAKYGDSLANYGDLTDAELRQVIAAFNDTANSSVSSIERIRNALGDIKQARADAANEAASVMSSGPVTSGGADYDKDFYDAQKKVLDQQIKDMQKAFNDANKMQQKANDAEYKALQKELDAEYKVRQKAYENEYNAYKKKLDKEYDAEKKALDKQYNALKKSLDAVYDARKKSYDKQEDALKDKLDDEYDALKKKLDKQYKARKKQLDDVYDARKKALDKEYNDLKKALDKEYKEYQKRNDKILKQLKDAQSKEVKAFKEATKARIAAIKAEYEARKKLLEGEDGTKELNERIKALEAETKAEREQAEAREEAEKIASLQSSVDQAKTRRKRQEAEKALNDYLAEIAQKRREKEREAEIDRLEEQKDAIKEVTEAKKDALDEERDAVIAAYEAEREVELEALQDQQDIEYEKLKDKLDAQEEAYKDHNDAILQALKDQQQKELDALSEKHDAILEKLKDAHQKQLDALKDANDGQLQALKDKHNAQLQALKDSQDEQLQALKDKQSEQLQALKDAQSDKLNAMKESQSEELEALKESQSDQLQALKDAQSDALEAEKEAQSDAIDAQKEANEKYLDEIKNGLRDRNGLVSDANDEMVKNTEDALDDMENHIDTIIGHRIVERTQSGFKEVGDTIDDFLYGANSAVQGGLRTTSNAFEDAMDDIGYIVDKTAGNMYHNGQEIGYNLGDGIRDTLWYVEDAARSVGYAIDSFLGHSTPDKGPLKDDDKWGAHLMQNIIDGMRDKQNELVAQVKRVSDAMEDAFDPTLTVDAAYDAIDSMRQVGGPLSYQNKGTQASPAIELNVSINLGNAVIRDESDIDLLAQRVSQSMAAATARELAGRLG